MHQNRDESQLSLNLPNMKSNNVVTKICPTCQGKGYFEEYVDKTTEEANQNRDSLDCVLPKIKGTTISRSSRPSRHLWRKSDMALPILPSKGTPTSRQRTAIKRSQLDKPIFERELSVPSNNSSDSLREFEIPHREIKNLSHFSRVTKMKLRGSSLDDITYGVINTVHLARKDSDYALTFMPQVNRHICTLLKSMKPYYIQVAYKVIEELYQKIPLISRPEFDEMIHLLLSKVSDLKISIRDGANDALDVIAANTPPQYIVRAIIVKGPRSKNPFVREASARILDHVVDSISPSSLMTVYNLREMRRNILVSGIQFLDDQSSGVRVLGRQIISKLMDAEEFDDVVASEVPQEMYKRVEKIILNIKYEKKTK